MEFYALKGWNVTFDNNSGKTFGLTLGYAPNSKLSVYANYLGGPERNKNSRDRRDLGDFQIVFGHTDAPDDGQHRHRQRSERGGTRPRREMGRHYYLRAQKHSGTFLPDRAGRVLQPTATGSRQASRSTSEH